LPDAERFTEGERQRLNLAQSLIAVDGRAALIIAARLAERTP